MHVDTLHTELRGCDTLSVATLTTSKNVFLWRVISGSKVSFGVLKLNDLNVIFVHVDIDTSRLLESEEKDTTITQRSCKTSPIPKQQRV